MEGNGYPQRSPVRTGRYGYWHNASVLYTPGRELQRQPAWLVGFLRGPGYETRIFRILLPQKGASIAPAAEASAFRIPALLHCARWLAVSAFSPTVARRRKINRNQVSLYDELRLHASRPLGGGLSPGCKKSEIIKEQNELSLCVRKTEPNHSAGFRHTFLKLREYSASGRIRPDTRERPV